MNRIEEHMHWIAEALGNVNQNRWRCVWADDQNGIEYDAYPNMWALYDAVRQSAAQQAVVEAAVAWRETLSSRDATSDEIHDAWEWMVDAIDAFMEADDGL